MVLDNISIYNYKNLRQVQVSFSPNINCFIGHNGEGKTNLLDAIYYLSFCRSSTNTLDRYVVTHGEEAFSLEGRYRHDSATETIHCACVIGRRKIVRRNGKAYQRLTEHIGLLPLILVTPQDALLVEAGSEERRRFMDVVIAQYDQQYVEALANYNKALQQRNALLRSEAPDLSLMEILEDAMAENGMVIYRKRESFITEFIPSFQRIYATIAAGKESVEMHYLSHCQRGDLLTTIREHREKDLLLGHSLCGIHRDDLDLLLDGYSIKREGSQGQNKTLVLAMKLAQFAFLQRTISRTTPLLLLDDIFDKLDAQRVEQIVALVAADTYGQIFITDTNRDHIDTILAASQSDYRLFHVEQGVVASAQ